MISKKISSMVAVEEIEDLAECAALQGCFSVRCVDAVCSSGLGTASVGLSSGSAFDTPRRSCAGQSRAGKFDCAGDKRAGDVFDLDRRPPDGDLMMTLPAGAGGNSEYLLGAGDCVEDLGGPANWGREAMVGVVCRRAECGLSPDFGARPSSEVSVDGFKRTSDFRFSRVRLRRASREEDEFAEGSVCRAGALVSSFGNDACRRMPVVAPYLSSVGVRAGGGDGSRSRIVFGSLPSCSFG